MADPTQAAVRRTVWLKLDELEWARAVLKDSQNALRGAAPIQADRHQSAIDQLDALIRAAKR